MSSSLPTVAFGRTDMRVSRVGFGAWAIGGVGWPDAWGAQDDAVSVAAIHRAVERGVNWIDTAPIYGHGHSEQVVARALRGLPEGDRPYVFTKAGPKWNPDEPMSPPALVGSPENIRAEVEASFRRLGVDRIDLLQMHWPPTDGTPIEEYWPALLDLRDQGKVRAVGLSNHDVPLLEAAEALGHVDLLQPKFSAVYRDAAADVLPWCADHDTAAIVYSPMVSGLLTGISAPGSWPRCPRTTGAATIPTSPNRALAPSGTGRRTASGGEPARGSGGGRRRRVDPGLPGSPVRSSARGRRNRSTGGSPRAAWRSTTTTSTRSAWRSRRPRALSCPRHRDGRPSTGLSVPKAARRHPSRPATASHRAISHPFCRENDASTRSPCQVPRTVAVCGPP